MIVEQGVFRTRFYDDSLKGSKIKIGDYSETAGKIRGESMNVIFLIIFIIALGIIIFSLMQGIATWNKNNQSPRLTVPAVVVAKRENITHHQHANAGDASGAHGFHTTTSTTYYVTFQVESGDRMEFCVSGTEYEMLVEGETGRLAFQGTRYLLFER